MPTGTVLGGRYLLSRPLGAGSSATVYLAEDRSLRREVAVKVLRTGLTADDGFLKRFRAEAVAVAGLNHPHVLRVFDWGEADGSAWLVTEYLAGGSLRELLDRRGTLALEQVVAIGAQAADGLAYAHARGFVHRDVKPTNLLFDDAGRVRITDFGVARALAEATWTEPNGLVGTVRYCSPEQALGRRVEPKTDVYSLALVLYECLTGEVPFTSDSQVATLHARVGAELPDNPRLGPLAHVLAAAAAPDPKDRLDASELWVELTEFAKALPDPNPVRAPRHSVGFVAPSAEELTGSGHAIASSSRVRRVHDLGTAAVLDETVHHGVDRTLVAESPMAERAPVPDALDPPSSPHRSARRGRIAFSLVIVAALVAAALVYESRHTPIASFRMPDVVGLGVTAVESDLSARHLAITQKFKESKSVPVGHVIAQRPGPGQRTDDGSHAELVVSLGPPPVRIPTVVGDSRAAAIARLVAAGFTASAPAALVAYSSSIRAGGVLGVYSGNLANPASAAYGSALEIALSKGPAPVAIPSVVGLSQASAVATLEHVGFNAVTRDVFSNSTPAGQVITTEPLPKAMLQPGQTVHVAVSKGPPVLVPALGHVTLAQAERELVDVGLTVLGVAGSAHATDWTCSPAPGTKVTEGSGVTLRAV